MPLLNCSTFSTNVSLVEEADLERALESFDMPVVGGDVDVGHHTPPPPSRERRAHDPAPSSRESAIRSSVFIFSLCVRIRRRFRVHKSVAGRVRARDARAVWYSTDVCARRWFYFTSYVLRKSMSGRENLQPSSNRAAGGSTRRAKWPPPDG